MVVGLHSMNMFGRTSVESFESVICVDLAVFVFRHAFCRASVESFESIILSIIQVDLALLVFKHANR
jgi:hypothetical protein